MYVPARQSQRLRGCIGVCRDLEKQRISKHSPIRRNQRTHVQDMRRGHHPVSTAGFLKEKGGKASPSNACKFVCVSVWKRERESRSSADRQRHSFIYILSTVLVVSMKMNCGSPTQEKEQEEE